MSQFHPIRIADQPDLKALPPADLIKNCVRLVLMVDKISYALAVLARVAIIVFLSLHGGIMLAASYWIATGQGRPGISRWLSIPVGIIGLGLVRMAYWVYNGKASELVNFGDCPAATPPDPHR